MKRILWMLTAIALTQGVCAMENDQTMIKVRRLKAQLETFESQTLDVQRGLLVKGLKYWREAKQSAKLVNCLKLGSPLPEYDGFDPTTKNFSLNTVLKFSGQDLPINTINPNDLKALIKHSINESSINVLKAKLSKDAIYCTEPEFNEELKKSRHDLLWTIHSSIEGYKESKILINNKTKTCLFPIIEDNALEFRPLKKVYAQNKSGEIKLLLKQIRSFGLICLKKELVIAQNKVCNDNCVLKTFEKLSNEELFDFYKTIRLKFDTLNIIFCASLSLLSAQEQVGSPSKGREAPLFIFPRQPTSAELAKDRLHKKWERKKNQSKSIGDEGLQMKQPMIPSIEKTTISLVGEKSQNQKRQKSQPQKQKAYYVPKKNENVNAEREKPHKQETPRKTNSITSSEIITIVNGRIVAVGPLNPDDGEKGFISVNSKNKRPQNNVIQYQNTFCEKSRSFVSKAPRQENIKPTPIIQMKLPAKLPELNGTSPTQPMHGSLSYAGIVQNLTAPKIEHISSSIAGTTVNDGLSSQNSNIKIGKILGPLQNQEKKGKKEEDNILRFIPFNSSAYESKFPNVEKKKKRAFLTNPTVNFQNEGNELLSQAIVETKGQLEVTEKPEVPNKPPFVERYLPSARKQPYPTVIYNAETFKLDDHPVIKQFISQKDNVHVYMHGYEEVAQSHAQAQIDLEAERRLRKALERELEELKQKFAQLEMEKK